MKLELLFDESVYRRQMELLYKLAYERQTTYFKNSHFVGFALLFLGVLAVVGKANIGYSFMFFGMFVLVPYYYFYFKQNRIKRKFEEERLAIISLYKENPKVTYKFNDVDFKYSDYTSNLIFSWDELLTFIELEENIFFFTKNSEPFIFGKAELGETNYNKLLKLLESKLKTVN
ncbi:hypothetical protein FIA58_012680 [Flavobacterium jejuense]|uniref:YcxB-like protein domain-containing protein n=1 Tax=Flavobacterium jejuense TaxID=1544455 RepID=A0ABX0IRQ6_9FLAO|nr:hypothetical protein [Flavobacterium jejuense]NHN26534.1 hypothetical protein [Flavobacterium jejuense]